MAAVTRHENDLAGFLSASFMTFEFFLLKKRNKGINCLLKQRFGQFYWPSSGFVLFLNLQCVFEWQPC